jgi:glycosyltransferase involved in cell wall biosynthesis
MKVCAVIPAYNEEKTIGKVVEGVRKYVDRVLVVDDGSNDNTAEVAKQHGAHVLKHIINIGVGAAQRTGYSAALLEGYDYIVQIDADGQHKPEYIPLLLETAVKSNADIVIGSRFLNESHKSFSFTRRAGISFFSKTVSIFGRVDITDVTSGFRVYSSEALKKLERIPDKNWAVEQTLEAAVKKLKIIEVSVEMETRKTGESQFNIKTFIMYPLRALESIIRIGIYRRG